MFLSRFFLLFLNRNKKALSTIASIFFLAYANSAYAVSFTLNGTPDLQGMLVNFSEAVPNLMRLVTALAYVMGFFFIIKGVIELKHFGDARSSMSHEHSLMKPLIMIGVGTLLVYLPSAVQMGLSTFWVDPNPYGYLPDSNSGDNWADFTTAIFMIVQLIGAVAFIRGLVLLTHHQSHGQQGTFGKALTYIIAGILCINLYQFLQAVFTTLGIGTLSP